MVMTRMKILNLFGELLHSLNSHVLCLHCAISRLKPNAALQLLDDEAEEQDKSSSQAETDSDDDEESQSGDASDESDPFVDLPKSRYVIFNGCVRQHD